MREARLVRPAVGAGRPDMPVGVGEQLFDALVVFVERLEEGDRVRDMDGHRDAQLAGGRPERIEARVVDGDQAAIRSPRAEAQRLPDLETAGSRRRRHRAGVPPPSRRIARRPPRRRSRGPRRPRPVPAGLTASARSRGAGSRPTRRRGRRATRSRRRRAWSRARPRFDRANRRRRPRPGGCGRRSPGTAGAGPGAGERAVATAAVKSAEAQVGDARAHPLSPLIAMPRTKYLLGDHEQDDHRRHAHESARHHLRPLADELALEGRQADGGRVLVELAQVDQRVDEVVPGPHEGEDRERREGRFRQRQVDVPVDLPRVGAVDAGRLGELARHGQEELA